MRKALLVIGCVLLVVIAGGAVFVGARQHLTFDAPYPDVVASTDSAIVERGHYIVRSVAPCASCHSDPHQRAAIENGEEVALSGGFEFNIPPGKFRVRN